VGVGGERGQSTHVLINVLAIQQIEDTHKIYARDQRQKKGVLVTVNDSEIPRYHE
jgi:hypothetical protein